MTPSQPATRRGRRGGGSVFQACKTRRGCPPMETVTLADGTTKRVRPKHKCNGPWVARLDLGPGPDGKPQRPKREAPTRNAALDLLDEMRKQVTTYGVVPQGGWTVETWLIHWLETIVRPNKSQKTYRNDRSAVTKHLIPGIGRHRAAKLQPQHLRDLYDQMGADGRVGSRPEVHRVIRKALGDAMPDGIVLRNVAKLVDAPSGLGTKRGALTSDEGRKLLAWVHREDDAGGLIDPFASRWAMALLTAQRQGECLGLELDRVDMKKRKMDVSWQLQRLIFSHGCAAEEPSNGVWPCGRKRAGSCPGRFFDVPEDVEYRQLTGGMCLTRPKTEASKRILPIPPPLYADLKVHFDADNGPNPHGLVWHESDGSPVDAKNDRARWYANLRNADLPRIVIHEARHTTITLLMEAGVDREIIKSIAGHASLVVQEAYKHVDTRHMAEALGHVAGALYLAETKD